MPAAADIQFHLGADGQPGVDGHISPMDPQVSESRSDFYQTPHLARLTRGGMRLSRGYAAADRCCLTRRSIQFGQTALRQGGGAAFTRDDRPGNVRHSIPWLLKTVDPTCKAADFGKWDLRCELTPRHPGYDESKGNTHNGTGSEGDNGAPDVIPKDDKSSRHVVLKDPKQIVSITDRATRFMQCAVQDGNPFFLQISHYTLRGGSQAAAEGMAPSQRLEQGNEIRGCLPDHDARPGHRVRQNPGRTGTARNHGPDVCLLPGGQRRGTVVSTQPRETSHRDGSRFRAVLEHERRGNVSRPTKGLVFHRYSDSYGHSAIRLGDYKLVRFWKVPNTTAAVPLRQLFHLGRDRGQRNNLASQLPARVREMEQHLLDYMRSVESRVLTEAAN